MTPLAITPSDLLATILLPVPTTFYFVGLEVLVSEGEKMLPPGDTTMNPLNGKLSPSPATPASSYL